MFQGYNPFRSEKKSESHWEMKTCNLDQQKSQLSQTAVKYKNTLCSHKTHRPCHSNDKFILAKLPQGNLNSVLTREFLTKTSEIQLGQEKYQILRISMDGKLIGVSQTQDDFELSSNCHFAVIQRLSQHSHESNCSLKCLVFELKFSQLNQNPVRVLYKGPFLQVRSFQSPNNLIESLKLKNIPQKSFNLQNFTFNLISDQNYFLKVDSQHEIERQKTTLISKKYQFSSPQEALAINFFHAEKLKQSVQVEEVQYSEQKNNEIEYLKTTSILKESHQQIADIGNQNEELEQNPVKQLPSIDQLEQSRQKLQEKQGFSNEKTIPEHVCQLQIQGIPQNQKNYQNTHIFQDQQEVNHSLVIQKKSPMIDQVHEKYLESSQKQEIHDFNQKDNKNLAFQQTTINKVEAILEPCKESGQEQEKNQIVIKMDEENQIIPQKLTFEQKKSNHLKEQSDSEQMMDQQSEKSFYQIDNYKIDQQIEKEIGGYQSQDLSQEDENQIQNSKYELMEKQVQVIQISESHSDQPQIESNLSNKFKQLLPQSETYSVIASTIKTQKIISPNQTQNLSQLEHFQALVNTKFSQSTFSLITNPQNSILCLQILKEQGKIHKSSNQPKSKDDLIKLILYNPLLLQNNNQNSNSFSSSDPHHKFFAINSFTQALHKVNQIQVSPNEDHLLLYSNHDHSHPVVLEYDLKKQRFTSMFKIPSLCQKEGITQKPLPLIRVQYLKNSAEHFCAITSKEICLYSKKAHKPIQRSMNQTYSHKIFVYKKLFGENRNSSLYEFDTFQIHENGKYLVAGINGRYVRVFDLEKQQEDSSKEKVKFKKCWKNPNILNNNKKQKQKHVRWQQTPRKTKRIKRILKSRFSKPSRQIYDNYKVYYLKSMNSFDLDDEENISPVSSSEQISLPKEKSQQPIKTDRLKITKIKLIYTYDETELNFDQNQSQNPERTVQSIYCQREDGKKYLISCLQETKSMGIVNCFENQLKISNRSLIKVLTPIQAQKLLMDM